MGWRKCSVRCELRMRKVSGERAEKQPRPKLALLHFVFFTATVLTQVRQRPVQYHHRRAGGQYFSGSKNVRHWYSRRNSASLRRYNYQREIVHSVRMSNEYEQTIHYARTLDIQYYSQLNKSIESNRPNLNTPSRLRIRRTCRILKRAMSDKPSSILI